MIDEFRNAVQLRIGPLLNSSHTDSVQMSEEIGQVAEILTAEAVRLLPHVQQKRKTRWRDETLSCLCGQSCAARKAWEEAGYPTEGPLYEEKGRLRRTVKRRVRFCAARAERLRIQRRDKMFAAAGSVHINKKVTMFKASGLGRNHR